MTDYRPSQSADYAQYAEAKLIALRRHAVYEIASDTTGNIDPRPMIALQEAIEVIRRIRSDEEAMANEGQYQV
ncbi:hypothetical protein OCOJLMKI_0088 [Methylobacterium iners]|uniref:Uncharacterized protein n=1 Tax=Methylobacterium iners TaxID=418707 RepID=A0ABQ4RRD9_9HYPH|nr:hypothetical protein OCOJLMKI_0088 [Methylobacterium iners]